jgi:DNA-binding NarL/FixJ family response regulator
VQASPQGSTAVVIAGDEEIRVLLRGLLRLHHFRVLGEAENEDEGIALIRTHTPKLVVADTNLAAGTVGSLFEGARRIVPQIRAVLVAPGRGDDAGPPPKADAVLQRPFRVRDFAAAVGASPSPDS